MADRFQQQKIAEMIMSTTGGLKVIKRVLKHFGSTISCVEFRACLWMWPTDPWLPQYSWNSFIKLSFHRASACDESSRLLQHYVCCCQHFLQFASFAVCSEHRPVLLKLNSKNSLLNRFTVAFFFFLLSRVSSWSKQASFWYKCNPRKTKERAQS